MVAPNFDLIEALASYDEKRLLQLVVLAMLTVWLITCRSARSRWLDTFACMPARSRWLLGLVVATGVASAAHATAPASGLLEVTHLALLGCLTLAAADVFRREGGSADAIALGCLMAAAAIFLLDFAVRYAAAVTLGSGVPPAPYRAFPAFSHPRFFGQWLTWTLPVVAIGGLLVPRAAWRARTLAYGVAAGWWLLLLVSATRGTLIAQAVALSFVAAVFGRRSRSWLRVQLACAAVGLTAYLVCYVAVVGDFSSFHAMLDHVASVSGSGRRELWTAALTMIGEHPLLGVGPQNYAYHAPVLAAHPHNVVLQWAAEWGAASALVVGALAVTALVAWLRRARYLLDSTTKPIESALICGLTGALAAGGTHAMVSGIFVMPLSQTLAVLVVGWTIGLYLRHPRDEREAHVVDAVDTGPVRGFASALPAAVAAAFIVVLVCAWPSAGRAWFEHRPGPAGVQERFSPRFWRRTVRTPLPPPPGTASRTLSN